MANFEKGKPRSPSAGRKKGTPNKATTTLRKQLADLDLNLGQEIMTALRSTADENIRFKLLELLTKYTQVVPTKEVDDVAPDINPAEALTTEELLELASLGKRDA